MKSVVWWPNDHVASWRYRVYHELSWNVKHPILVTDLIVDYWADIWAVNERREDEGLDKWIIPDPLRIWESRDLRRKGSCSHNYRCRTTNDELKDIISSDISPNNLASLESKLDWERVGIVCVGQGWLVIDRTNHRGYRWHRRHIKNWINFVWQVKSNAQDWTWGYRNWKLGYKEEGRRSVNRMILALNQTCSILYNISWCWARKSDWNWAVIKWWLSWFTCVSIDCRSYDVTCVWVERNFSIGSRHQACIHVNSWGPR